MITLIDNALQLDSDCALVSCRFDTEVLRRDSMSAMETEWGISLPEKLQNAVDKRKAEFIAGRYCARRAMALLADHGASSQIDIGAKRQPLWPAGLTGSITHSHGFAAAAVARQDTVRSVGIDSEQLINAKTASNVASHILTDAERFADNQAIAANSAEYLTLVFSAKESIFKCLYPLVGQYFDFKDAVIDFSEGPNNSFHYRLRKTLSDEFTEGYQGGGSFQRDGDFVHTAVTLKPHP